MTTGNGWMKHDGGCAKLRITVCVVDLGLDECRGMNVERE